MWHGREPEDGEILHEFNRDLSCALAQLLWGVGRIMDW